LNHAASARLTCRTKWTNHAGMKTVNVHEAKTHFSRLIASVETANESFVICRNGEPVADLVPHRRSSRIKPHPLLRNVKIGYDPVEPLTTDEWPQAAR
jgi:antitoxin (DNA-binding transcriptional repressor) of toxin-antitoxin stability system